MDPEQGKKHPCPPLHCSGHTSHGPHILRREWNTWVCSVESTHKTSRLKPSNHLAWRGLKWHTESPNTLETRHKEVKLKSYSDLVVELDSNSSLIILNPKTIRLEIDRFWGLRKSPLDLKYSSAQGQGYITSANGALKISAFHVHEMKERRWECPWQLRQTFPPSQGADTFTEWHTISHPILRWATMEVHHNHMYQSLIRVMAGTPVFIQQIFLSSYASQASCWVLGTQWLIK